MADRTFSFDRFELSSHTSSSFNQQKFHCFDTSHLARSRLRDSHLLAIAVMTVVPLTFSPDALLITSLSLTRALASRALTVPGALRGDLLFLRMLKPSMSRNWKVVRKVGDSREVARASVSAISPSRYASSGPGRVSETMSSRRSCCASASSKAIGTDVKRRRSFIRAELITIVVSHVDIFACPLNR
jgi:hypothetical protein